MKKLISLFVCLCLVADVIFIRAADCNRNRINRCKHGKCEENIDDVKSTSWIIAYARKSFKRRLKYSSSHPGSFNPAAITNKQAHTVLGNMENTTSKNNLKRKVPAKISDYFAKSDKRPTCATGEFTNFP